MMYKIFIKAFLVFAFAVLFFTTFCFAQNNATYLISTSRVVKQPLYNIAHPITESYFKVSSSFGKPNLIFPDNAPNHSLVSVTAIHLIFTDYPSSDNLVPLNTARIKNFLAKYPSLNANENIRWQLIRQTNGAVKEAGEKLFHGFVVYYRALQNNETAKADLVKLKEMLEPKITDRQKRNGFVAADTSELRKRYEIEPYTTVLKLPVIDALNYLGIDVKEKNTYKDYDSLFVFLKPSTDSLTKTNFKFPEDSTVIKVLDRMRWQNMLVVADVTASMYPYSGQLLLWLKQHEDERLINSFVFFNDGDNMDDDRKQPGITGGIYSTNSSVFGIVEQLVYKTMSSGNGGNIPENNIEALLKGAQGCPNCESIIMIADNASSVSDMVLLPQLNKKVHIILCGVRDIVNANYFAIAKATGGSVHVEHEDLLQLSTINEGESFLFIGHSYKYVGGKFVVQK